MIHKLKVEEEYFTAIFAGDKTFEVRKNDRDFKLSDELLLEEIIPYCERTDIFFTGRILHRRVTYILTGGKFGIEDGYCVMALEKV